MDRSIKDIRANELYALFWAFLLAASIFLKSPWDTIILIAVLLKHDKDLYKIEKRIN